MELHSSAPLRDDRLTVSEAEAITGVKRTHINRLLDEGHFTCLWDVDRASGRRMLDLDLCVFVKFHETSGKQLTPRARYKLWDLFVEKVSRATIPLVLVTGPGQRDWSFVLDDALTIDMTPHWKQVCANWAVLRQSRGAIESKADVRGGLPVIAGTRIGAYEVADVVERAGLDEALALYPSLDAAKVDAAVIYAKANPRPGRPAGARGQRPGEARPKAVRKHSRKIG